MSYWFLDSSSTLQWGVMSSQGLLSADRLGNSLLPLRPPAAGRRLLRRLASFLCPACLVLLCPVGAAHQGPSQGENVSSGIIQGSWAAQSPLLEMGDLEGGFSSPVLHVETPWSFL